jgi:hypothetical protein
MSYTENGGGLTAADVSAVMNGGYRNNGSFFGGGDGAWWLIILLLFANNGWGGGFGWGGGMGGMMPWMMSSNTNNDVQRGFDQSAIMGSLNGITSALSNGFANAEISRCNANMNVLQAMNANQAATLQNMNTLSMGLQNCCCENRAGLADLKYTVATENCQDRQVVSDGIRDLIASNAANTQSIKDSTNAGFTAIMDKICALELAGKDQQIAALQGQLNEANRQASQAAQTAALEQYMNNLWNRYNGCGCNNTCCGNV